MPIKTPIILILILVLVACAGGQIEPDPALVAIQTPQPVIFDTDMAHEDMNAALYLLAHPNVDLLAITVSGTGEAHCGPGVDNALGLLVAVDQMHIPVACGPEAPLEGNHAFPAAWRQGADAAYGVDLPAGPDIARIPAPELIVDFLNGAQEPIHIIAVGPLTNIAAALEIDPQIVGKIAGITIMGGAVETGGNVGPSGAGIDNEFAEWNIYIDPYAAAVVFQSGVPVTLIPLDATDDVPVNGRFVKALEQQRQSPGAQLVYQILEANSDFVDSPGFDFWDSLTAAVFTDPTLVTFEEMHLTVVQEEGPENGRTKADPTGSAIRVATAADQSRFEQLFLTVLNWRE